jgi:hypothetical protein
MISDDGPKAAPAYGDVLIRKLTVFFSPSSIDTRVARSTSERRYSGSDH